MNLLKYHCFLCGGWCLKVTVILQELSVLDQRTSDVPQEMVECSCSRTLRNRFGKTRQALDPVLV